MSGRSARQAVPHILGRRPAADSRSAIDWPARLAIGEPRGDPRDCRCRVELTDAALASDVVDGLALVEEGLRVAAQAEHEVLTEASAHLIEAGGKRFRPMLVLLAAQFGDPRDPRVVPAAVAVELTHLATLYHDDVMDEADVRRGSAQRELPLGQHRRDPDRRLPVRQGLADPGRPRPGGDPDPGRDVRAGWSPGRSPRPSARRPATIRSSTTCGVVTEKTGFADRDRRPVRRDVLRRAGERGRPDHAGLRGARRGLPALRRHPRRGQRPGPVRQDARHRPARGRADAADAARAAVGRRRRDARLVELLRHGRAHRPGPAQRGARPAARRIRPWRWPGRHSGAGPRRPGTRSAACPTSRPGPHSRPCASSLSSAPGRQVGTRGPGRSPGVTGGWGLARIRGKLRQARRSAARC